MRLETPKRSVLTCLFTVVHCFNFRTTAAVIHQGRRTLVSGREKGFDSVKNAKKKDSKRLKRFIRVAAFWSVDVHHLALGCSLLHIWVVRGPSKTGSGLLLVVRKLSSDFCGEI